MNSHPNDTPSASSFLMPLIAVLVIIGIVGVVGFGLAARQGEPEEAPTPVVKGVPSPTFNFPEGGNFPLGRFDTEALSRFFLSVNLPAITNPLPPIEREECLSFHEALKALDRTRGAEEYGLVGLFLHNYELYDLADACYTRAGEAAPNDFKWPHYRGYLALNLEEIGDAEQHFKLALEKNNTYAPTYMHLGRLYQLQDRLGEAEQMFSKASDLAPDNPYPYAELGNIALLREDFFRAEKNLLKTLEIRPGDQRAHSLLGRVYTRLENREKANYHIYLAGQGVPYDDPVPDDLTLDLRRRTNSLNYLDMVVKKSFALRAWDSLVQALLDITERDNRLHWKIKLSDAYRRRALAASKDTGEPPNFGPAREWAETALEQSTDIPEPHVALAKIGFAENDFTLALKKADDALKVEPASKAALVVKLQTLATLDRAEPALEVADRLLEVDRADWESHHWRAKVLFKLAQQQQAKAAHKQSLDYLGACIVSLQQAAKLNPSAENVAKDLADTQRLGQTYLEDLKKLATAQRAAKAAAAASQPTTTTQPKPTTTRPNQ